MKESIINSTYEKIVIQGQSINTYPEFLKIPESMQQWHCLSNNKLYLVIKNE